MPCGVTTSVGAATVTCDNSGTSSHTGNHSGLLSTAYTIWGFTWSTSTRIFWKASVAKPVKQKQATVGESDFA